MHKTWEGKCEGETLLCVSGFVAAVVLLSICFILAHAPVYCQVNTGLVRKQVFVFTPTSPTPPCFAWSEDSLERRKRFFSVCA